MTDYTVGDTLHIAFTTRAFATGVPTVLSGSPVVSAYENADLTQITAGITLGVDHDSVVGLNMLTIVATGANGFESGKDYHMVITTGTVGGVSVVGEVVGGFTLGRSAAAVDLANATDGLGAIKTETAAILDDTDLIDDGTSGLAKIATDVAAVLVDTATTLQGELDAIQAAVITNAAGVDIAADIIALKAETALILADTGTDGVVVAAGSKTGYALTSDYDYAKGTVAMTESYAANGAAPTPVQATMAIHQMLMQFGIGGTSYTVRQLDDTTPAFVVTLDDATAPTDAKRV